MTGVRRRRRFRDRCRSSQSEAVVYLHIGYDVTDYFGLAVVKVQQGHHHNGDWAARARPCVPIISH